MPIGQLSTNSSVAMVKNILTGLFCSALVFTGCVQADTSSTPLTPFTAHYASTWDVGLKIGGEATRQLQQTNDGNWQFSLTAKAMLAKLNEHSLLQYDNGQLLPLKYSYQRKILKRKTHVNIDFDWSLGQATTHTSDSWTMPISAPLQDKLSVQLQLQRDLAQAKQINTHDQLSYAVAAGGQIEAFHYQIIGTETLSTPLGDMQAIKVERLRSESSNRLTYIWFAPAINFHVVRILQQEPDGKQYQLDLKQLNY